jgi:hypothetical protein
MIAAYRMTAVTEAVGPTTVSSQAWYVISITLHNVVQELGYRLDAGNQEMIASAGAGNVK